MKIFKIAYGIILALLIAIALLVVVSTFPVTGNIKLFAVLSGSMEPTIQTGSVVLVKPSADTYKINDIITFQGTSNARIPVTHRIVDIRVEQGNPIYITKGDANNAPDTREIKQNEVIGNVLFSTPYIGYAVETARKPYGFLALIILPALIIIFDQAGKIWKEVKRIKKLKN